MKYSHRYTIAGLLNLFVFIAEVLLTLRVLLRFFNGNPDALFIHWVYTNTQPLLEPFRAVFPESWNVINRGWVVDFPALFAMAIYPVFGALMVSLVGGWAVKNWVEWKSVAGSRRR